MAMQIPQKNINVDELKNYIKTKIAGKINDLQKVILFGSCAKNTQHESSDIDLVLVAPRYRDCDYLDESVKVMKLFSEYDCRVEPHIFTPEEIESEDFFAQEIMRTGIVLYSS